MPGQNRGSFDLASILAIPQSVLDQITAAQTQAAAAMTRANQAASTASTANTAASDASTTAASATSAAQSLQAAVDAGNAVHTALSARIDALVTALASQKQTIATSTKPTVILALGASGDIAFTFSRALPNTNYSLDIVPAPALLGAATFTEKAGSRTTTGVTITVKATVAVTAGNQITLIAFG